MNGTDAAPAKEPTAVKEPVAPRHAAPEPEPVEDDPALPVDHPAHPRADESGEPTEGDEPGVSPAQIKMMAALMNQLGMTDRDSALAFVADVIGREVESRNDLTKHEASKVIDALQADLGESPAGEES